MKKYHMEVTPDMDKIMFRLIVKQDLSSVHDLLRNSIALMKVAQDAKDEGKKLVIVDKDGRHAEVILPGAEV